MIEIRSDNAKVIKVQRKTLRELIRLNALLIKVMKIRSNTNNFR